MKYSVIIPVYNMEAHVAECIESILKQNRSDIEVIIVNDGSKDNSLKICKEIEGSNTNVHVIDKENSGSMDSWIRGVEESVGEYICFVDSDDMISLDYFEQLDKCINKTHCDIVMFDFCKLYKNQSVKEKVNKIEYGEIIGNRLEDLKKFYYNDYEKYSLYRWDKVIKSKIIKENIKKIKCRTIYFEDHPISLLNLWSANSIYYINECLYYYRMRKSSVSHKVNKKIFTDNVIIEEEMKKILQDKNVDNMQIEKMRRYFLFQYARWALKCDERVPKRKVTINDILKSDSTNKKIILLLYKLNLKFLFIVINKINHLKDYSYEYYI